MTNDLLEATGAAPTPTPIPVAVTGEALGSRSGPRTPPVRIDPMLRYGNAFYLTAFGGLHLLAGNAVLGQGDWASRWIGTSTLSVDLGAALWFATAALFVISAALLAVGRHWRAPLTAAAIASIGLSLAWLPQSSLGLLVNAFVVLGLVVTRPRR